MRRDVEVGACFEEGSVGGEWDDPGEFVRFELEGGRNRAVEKEKRREKGRNTFLVR